MTGPPLYRSGPESNGRAKARLLLIVGKIWMLLPSVCGVSCDDPFWATAAAGNSKPVVATTMMKLARVFHEFLIQIPPQVLPGKTLPGSISPSHVWFNNSNGATLAQHLREPQPSPSLRETDR